MTVRNQSDVQITVDPCLQSETTFDAASKDTQLSTDLPPTSRVSVKWTEKQASDVVVAEPAKQPLSLLVEHEHLFRLLLLHHTMLCVTQLQCWGGDAAD